MKQSSIPGYLLMNFFNKGTITFYLDKVPLCFPICYLAEPNPYWYMYLFKLDYNTNHKKYLRKYKCELP